MTRNSILGAGALIFVHAASGTATVVYQASHAALWALSAGLVVGVLATCAAYYAVRELIRRRISSAAETTTHGRDAAPISGTGRHRRRG